MKFVNHQNLYFLFCSTFKIVQIFLHYCHHRHHRHPNTNDNDMITIMMTIEMNLYFVTKTFLKMINNDDDIE